MNIIKSGIFALALASSLALTATAQDASQDMRKAGTETKSAAKDTAHGITKGTKKAYHKTAKGTEKAYDKTANGTEKAYDKTAEGTKKAYHKTADGTKKAADKLTGK
jgi:hypothetical protein